MNIGEGPSGGSKRKESRKDGEQDQCERWGTKERAFDCEH
jgi:hypothetical protein